MKLFISDLDGTLLDHNARLSPRSERILKELIRQGMRFTVASGRTPLSAVPLLRSIGIGLPLVLMNGALIYEPNTHQCLHSVEFGPACVHALADAEERAGVCGMILSAGGEGLSLHMGRHLQGHLWEHYYDLPVLGQIGVRGPEEQSAADLEGSRVLYALYMDDRPERLAEMCRILSQQPGLFLDSYRDIYLENRWCLEITSSETSKGHAVERLRRLCCASYVVGFGDGKNDLPLFDACDACFAVSNGCQEVKDRADSVIGSNLEDGVALCLQALWEREQGN